MIEKKGGLLFMTSTTSTSQQETITLSPDYRLPAAILTIGLGLIFLGNSMILGSQLLSLIVLILGIIISLFSFFLTLQTAIIRLSFTEEALAVYRSQKLIRNFPYSDWSNWEIFWKPVPILFYFREVNSIHFIPVLFDVKTLRKCLEERITIND